MSREPTIDRQGVKYQRALATQMPGASGVCRLKESNSKKGGAKLNAKTNTQNSKSKSICVRSVATFADDCGGASSQWSALLHSCISARCWCCYFQHESTLNEFEFEFEVEAEHARCELKWRESS
jgi:hypothetical protein